MDGTTPGDDPIDTHRAERNRRLAINVAFGVAGRIANAVLTLATVSVLLRLLGAERYGIYVTITAALGWLQLGILGVGKGLVNTLVAAHARGDEAEARRYLWSFWAGLAALVVATGVVAAATFPLVPWGTIFPPPPGVPTREVVLTVAIATAFTLLVLALSPVSYVLTAYQDERKSTVWTVVRNAMALGAVVVVFATGPSMPHVAAATGAATLAANAASLAWLLVRDKPFLRPRAGDVRRDHLTRALAASASFFALDVAGILVYQTDKLLILRFAGATAVAEFELASVGFLLAQSIFGVVLLPMWPALGEAVSRGDHAWARGALARLVRGSALGMTAALALGVALGPLAIRLWTGGEAVVPSRLLLALVGLYYAVRSLTECHTIALFVLDRQREMFRVILLNGVLVVALGVALGRVWGVCGVALANVVAYALTQGVFIPLRARRHLAALGG